MRANVLNVVDYFNAFFKKMGVDARVKIGKRTNTATDGIYFYKSGNQNFNAIKFDELGKIVKQNAGVLDQGVCLAIENFSKRNSSIINEGAAFIPLEKCKDVAQMLGVDQ